MLRPENGQSLLDFLNHESESATSRRPHRLSHDDYAATDVDYFFTVCVRQHRDVFRNERLAMELIEALLWRRERHGWTLFCYCLMPDHLHFIVRPPEELPSIGRLGARPGSLETVLEQVGYFKQFTTTRVWWRSGGNGALWQRSSYDRLLRSGDSLTDAAYYVLNNPVRKGLAEDWEQYRFSAIVDDWR